MTVPGVSKLVGLIPAAGRATRIAPLPCSKEIYPVGFRRDEGTGELRPRVVSQHLLEKFQRAGITRAFVIVRSGKWDILAYFGDGRLVNVDLAYIVIEESIGPPDTLDRAFTFVENDSIAFGFPDILFGPDDAFERLLVNLNDTRSDVVLGMYPALESRPMDMIEIDDEGRVRSMMLKPRTTTLKYTWACAVWRPTFTQFMHRFLSAERVKFDTTRHTYRDVDAGGDLPVGAVIKSAVEEGMDVRGVVFLNDSYLDIGTPDNLVQAVRSLPLP